MKRRRFAEEQIIRILQEAEASTDIIQNIYRKHAVSEQTGNSLEIELFILRVCGKRFLQPN
jgi:hypothetical protein